MSNYTLRCPVCGSTHTCQATESDEVRLSLESEDNARRALPAYDEDMRRVRRAALLEAAEATKEWSEMYSVERIAGVLIEQLERIAEEPRP